jgi:hypothetical protein
VLIALSPLALRAGGTRVLLSALDAARLQDVALCEVAAAAGPGRESDSGERPGASFCLAEICAASGPGRARR